MMWNQGSVDTVAGYSNEEPEASFNKPFEVAVDSAGQLLVTDESNHRVCFIDLRGGVSTLAGQGYQNGPASQAAFDHPRGLVVTEDGTVLVADSWKNRIRKITPQGEVSAVGTGSAGFKDGSLSEACFYSPWGLALDGTGSLIVADHHNHRIRRVTPQGVTTLAGNGHYATRDGPAQEASFKNPRAVAAGPNGDVMVTDEKRLCLISKGRVLTVATGFNSPNGLLVDCRGNAIVADTGNHQLMFCTFQGAVTVIAGNGEPLLQDGPSREASFYCPRGLALDHQGRVMVADYGNHVVRALSLPSTKRLQLELSTLQSPLSSSLPVGCSVTRSAKNLFKWSAVLQVAEGPFRGHPFELSLEMPFDYPVSGPLVKFLPPIVCVHPNVNSETGEVSYGEVNQGSGSDENKGNSILGVLEAVRTLLSGELLVKQVSLAEQELTHIGPKGWFEWQSTYDKRVAESRRALRAAKAELAAFHKAATAEAIDGSVGFWSRKLQCVLDPSDLVEAASKLSAANFKQRHWGRLSRDELKESGLTQGVVKDLMEHQAATSGNAGQEVPVSPSSVPPVTLHIRAPLLPPRILETELRLGPELGRGSCSMVQRAVWTRPITVGRQQVSQVEVAVKMSRFTQGSEALLLSADMARDLAVISNLPHQNILIVHGVCESALSSSSTAITKVVFELMSTDLAKLLARCEQQRLPMRLLLRVLRDVSAGLAHLHHHKVLHGDVKPANVLLRKRGEVPGNESSSLTINELEQFEHVKLCDFGSSKDLQQSLQTMTVGVGTLDYMAPEMLHREPLGEAADVWSFGVVLFECATGRVCRTRTPLAELEAELKSAGCGAELVQMFEQCHQMEQKQRPTMATIHDQLQRLVMTSISDEHTLRQELKRAVAQDQEAYNMTWDNHYVAQRAMPSLLSDVARLARAQPATRVVRQPLRLNGGKGSLDELKRLASSTGGATRLHSQLQALVENCGGRYVRDRKSDESSVRKVTRDYAGDYSLLLDLERATGLFDEASGMLQCLQQLGQNVTVLRCKDKLNCPLESGYRDVLLNVRDQRSGFVAELQLNFHKIAEIKSHAHRIYELTRVLDLPWVM